MWRKPKEDQKKPYFKKELKAKILYRSQYDEIKEKHLIENANNPFLPEKVR